MSGKTLLRDHLGPSIAKALAKMIVPVSAITDPLVDFIGEHISDRAKADEALKTIDRLVDRCLGKVSPEFERAKDVNPEAVAIALGETVERHLDIEALVAEDLKPERIHEMALTARPLEALRAEAYGENNVQLYRRALPKLVVSLVEAAPELKGYTVAKDREMLSRQRALGEDVGEIKTGIALVDAWMMHKSKRWQAYGCDYCQFVDRVLNVIELIGLPTDGAVKEQRLSTAFIPLTLNHDSDGEGGGRLRLC